MVEVLTLIQQTREADKYGDPVVRETSREVFARMASVSQREFYQAHAVGFQPELRFVLADYLDYENEPVVIFEGVRYRVLRTYRSGYSLELTCTREVIQP